MNQGCVGRGNAVVFSRAANYGIYISDSPVARFLWSILAGVSVRVLFAARLRCWRRCGCQAEPHTASLLSCGPTSLYACVILGVCTLFCERTLPHSHIHTHTLFWSNSSASQLSTRTTTKHHQHGGHCRCIARRSAKSLQVIVRHTREVCHIVEDGSYRVSNAQS